MFTEFPTEYYRRMFAHTGTLDPDEIRTVAYKTLGVDVGLYAKKPVVVEAEQWGGTAADATRIINWALANGGTIRYQDHAAAPDCPGMHETGPFRFCDQRGCDWTDTGADLSIDTLEGTMRANPGDWIIRGVKNEFYPCKPDIFNETYAPATLVTNT